MSIVYWMLALIAALSWVVPAARADDDSDHSAIVTESGPLTGIVNATGQVNEYLGIPYALPPVGALRWMPPQPFGRWHGVFAATAPGHDCSQEKGGQEDCLYLNVYTPNSKRGEGDDDEHEGEGFAVMVWIHGGGLTQGAGREYDPTPLVEGGGVVVVTLNYRLGLLGFLAHPALDHEGHLAGNYGLMDQQLAITWVKHNIAAFRGNPHRVTIFGESAGGLSVYSQLASPLAAGLFERAIAQSGAYASFADYLDHVVPIAMAETVSTPAVESGIAVADSLGCTSQTAACLRRVPASAAIGLKPRAIFPFIDGVLLRQTLRGAFSSGDFNRVPVMTGTNHDEYRYFVATNFDLGPTGPLANECSASVTTCYRTALGGTYGSLTLPQLGSVLAIYPVPPSGSLADAGSLMLGTAGTDGTFACTARHAMQALATRVTVYAYEFNDVNAPIPQGYSTVSFPMGAYHGGDVQYLFNRGGVPAPFTSDQAKLSQAMIAYWTRFAKDGHPNAPGQPHWAPYDPSTDTRLSLVAPMPGVESGFAADHMCGLWNLF